MTRTQIKEEDGIHNEWYEATKDITLDELPTFMQHLMDDYEHDYGTICHAIAAGAIATARAMDRDESQGGITGMQASFIMWIFVQKWMGYEDRPLVLIQGTDLLYPQYDYKFKTITKDMWEWVQNKAKENLKEDNPYVSSRVLAHWAGISDGHVPFGLTIRKEEDE